MSGIVWGERRPGEITTLQENEDGTVEVLVDPHLSPDWVRIPLETPGPLSGVVARVERSVWFPYAPDPDASPGESPWREERTRWHMIRPETGWDKAYPLTVAETSSGWVLLDLGPERYRLMVEILDLVEVSDG